MLSSKPKLVGSDSNPRPDERWYLSLAARAKESGNVTVSFFICSFSFIKVRMTLRFSFSAESVFFSFEVIQLLHHCPKNIFLHPSCWHHWFLLSLYLTHTLVPKHTLALSLSFSYLHKHSLSLSLSLIDTLRYSHLNQRTHAHMDYRAHHLLLMFTHHTHTHLFAFTLFLLLKKHARTNTPLLSLSHL